MLRICFACMLLSAATGLAGPTNQPVRMVLQWEHQAQFAGYYMALDKGFYKSEGLDVTLLPGGADVDPFKLVRTGQADFCSAMLSSVLNTYQQDQGDMVLLAQIINRSNLALVAWKNGRNGDTAIERPEDLNQKRITVWDAFHPPYDCFFKRYDITAQKLPQYYTFSLFLHKGADACTAMLYNEVHAIRQRHIPDDKLTVFDFYDLGINFPEDGIYCLKKTWQDRPEVCEAFARASMKGWKYAQLHADETLDAVMRRIEEAKLPTNRAHMQWMLNTVLASIFPANPAEWAPGVLSKASYDEAVSIMSMKDRAPAYTDFATKGAQHGLD